MQIAVIVLNFNGWRDTKDCLESLENARKGHDDISLIVIDNGSTDDSYEKLSKIKDIVILKNDVNLGYSGGNNVGIRYSLNRSFDFLLIINNDTYVNKNFFAALKKELPQVEIASPKIYFAPGFEFHKSRYKKADLGKVIWYAGGKVDWKNILGVHIGVDDIDNGQFDQSFETEFATGACLIVKREVFEKIGLFDEKYFLYLEDLDFCVRSRKEGFKISFLPQVSVWHKNAASSGGSGSKLQDYYITRNRLLFAFKFAKLKTKFAVLKQTIKQSNIPEKREALIDFLRLKFGGKTFKTL